MAEQSVVTAHDLRFERILDAPVETVWRYLADGHLRARWLMGGATDPRSGGRIEFTFDHDRLSDGDSPMPERYHANIGKRWTETVTQADPPRMIAFTWIGGEACEVIITLEPAAGNRATFFSITPACAGRKTRAISAAAGWLISRCCRRASPARPFPISGKSTPKRRPRRQPLLLSSVAISATIRRSGGQARVARNGSILPPAGWRNPILPPRGSLSALPARRRPPVLARWRTA